MRKRVVFNACRYNYTLQGYLFSKKLNKIAKWLFWGFVLICLLYAIYLIIEWWWLIKLVPSYISNLYTLY